MQFLNVDLNIPEDLIREYAEVTHSPVENTLVLCALRHELGIEPGTRIHMPKKQLENAIMRYLEDDIRVLRLEKN